MDPDIAFWSGGARTTNARGRSYWAPFRVRLSRARKALRAALERLSSLLENRAEDRLEND